MVRKLVRRCAVATPHAPAAWQVRAESAGSVFVTFDFACCVLGMRAWDRVGFGILALLMPAILAA